MYQEVYDMVLIIQKNMSLTYPTVLYQPGQTVRTRFVQVVGTWENKNLKTGFF